MNYYCTPKVKRGLGVINHVLSHPIHGGPSRLFYHDFDRLTPVERKQWEEVEAALEWMRRKPLRNNLGIVVIE